MPLKFINMRKSKSNTKRFKLSVTNYAKFITKDKALPCKINKLPKGQCSRNWRGPRQKDKNDVILSIFISLILFYCEKKIFIKNNFFHIIHGTIIPIYFNIFTSMYIIIYFVTYQVL